MTISVPLIHRDLSIRIPDSNWKKQGSNPASKHSTTAEASTPAAVAEFMDSVNDGLPASASLPHARNRLVHQKMETGDIAIPSSDYRKYAERMPKLGEKGIHFLTHLTKLNWIGSNIRVRLLRPVNRGRNIHLTLSQIREFIYCGIAAVNYLQSTGRPFSSLRLATTLLRRSAVIVAKLRAHWEKELAAKQFMTEPEKKLILDAHTLALSCAMRYTFLNKDSSRAVVSRLNEAHAFLANRINRSQSGFDFAKLGGSLELILPKEMLEDACENLDQFETKDFSKWLDQAVRNLPSQETDVEDHNLLRVANQDRVQIKT